MSSLSGILSFDDAFNTDAFPSLNPQKLELGTIERSRVNTYFPSYYQPILYDGIKLVLQTPAVEMPCLTYHRYSAGDAILVSVSKWLRQQFNIIDDFVRDNVVIPDALSSKMGYRDYGYKPICKDDLLYLIMSKSCSISQDTKDSVIELSTAERPPLSEGLYSLTLTFEHVYLGWHRYDCLYSTNFRITHIHFKPKTLNEDCDCDSTHVEVDST